MASQRRQPTLSPRNNAAPSVTRSGLAWITADKVDNCMSDSAITKLTVARTSAVLRIITDRINSTGLNQRCPNRAAQSPNKTAPPMPNKNRICQTGISRAAKTMNMSVSAKASIASVIQAMPLRLSINRALL